MAEKITFENGRISNFQGLVTLTFDRVILHTVVHHSSTSTYMPNVIEIEETFRVRTYVHLRSTLVGRLRRVDKHARRKWCRFGSYQCLYTRLVRQPDQCQKPVLVFGYQFPVPETGPCAISSTTYLLIHNRFWIIPATSVAANIDVDLCLKAVMTSLRSTWLISPWRRPTTYTHTQSYVHRMRHLSLTASTSSSEISPNLGLGLSHQPYVGPGYPLSCLFSSLVHSLPHLLLFFTFPFLVRFTYSILSSIPSLSTRIFSTPFTDRRS